MRAVMRAVMLCLLAACARAPERPLVTHAAGVDVAAASFAGSGAAVLEAARQYPPPGQAQATLASLTAEDGTGLELTDLEVRAAVIGPLAFTELHLSFTNPEPRVREGRFSLQLPPGATVDRLAMEMGGEWREAEVVALRRGREAYEAGMHARRDPALAELVPGGKLSARVFPIPANGQQRLIVAYVAPLARANAPYRLPLVGLPAVHKLRAAVVVDDQPHTLALDDVAPAEDFEVPAAKPGAAGLHSGKLGVVRVAPRVDGAPEPPQALTILFDTSASRVWRYPDEVARLDALVHALAASYGADLPLRVVAFDQTVEIIFEGAAGTWGERDVDQLLVRRPLGATNLGGALAWLAGRAHGERLLVWTDAVATAGAEGVEREAALAAGGYARVDVVLADTGHDLRAARGLVATHAEHDGVVLAASLPPAEMAGRLGRRAVSGVKVSVPGAAWVHPSRLDGVQAGDELLVAIEWKQDPAPGKGEQDIQLELGGALAETHELTLAYAPAPLVDHAWAATRIAELEARGPGARGEIVALSRAHRVLSRHAALLVLEHDADYAAYGIDVSQPSQMMLAGRTGLRVVPRRRAPAAVGKASPTAAAHGDATIRGQVVDQQTSAPAASATVVAMSPALIGTPAVVTDANGRYEIAGVPAGEYLLTFYYGQLVVQRAGVDVPAGGIAVIDQRIDTAASGGAAVIDQDYTQNVPVTGRTYEGAVGAAPGTGDDEYGVSFSGSDSAENVYIVDGVNTTDTTYGSTGIAEPAAPPPPEEAPPLPDQDPHGDGSGAARGSVDDDALAAAIARHAARPDNVVALRALGEMLAARGQAALAARVYGSLLDLYPGRADMQRAAGQWLEGLGAPGADLALDAYARALADRPDQATGYLMAAMALTRLGRHQLAFELLARALKVHFPDGRFAGFQDSARQLAGVVAAAWAASEPAHRDAILARARALGADPEEGPTLRLLCTWETDTSDVDLHVIDGDGNEASASAPTLPDYGGTLVADVSTGYGPELFVIDAPDVWPYHVKLAIQTRGATGLVIGRVQLVWHDGKGGVRLEDRPFAVAAGEVIVDLGEIERP